MLTHAIRIVENSWGIEKYLENIWRIFFGGCLELFRSNGLAPEERNEEEATIALIDRGIVGDPSLRLDVSDFVRRRTTTKIYGRLFSERGLLW